MLAWTRPARLFRSVKICRSRRVVTDTPQITPVRFTLVSPSKPVRYLERASAPPRRSCLHGRTRMHGPINDDRIVTMSQRELDETIARACDQINRSRWATFILALSVLFVGLLIGSLVVRDQVRAVTARLQTDIDALNATVASLDQGRHADSDLGLSDDEWQAIEDVETSFLDRTDSIDHGLSATATTPGLLSPYEGRRGDQRLPRAAEPDIRSQQETWDAIVIDEEPDASTTLEMQDSHGGRSLPRQWEPGRDWRRSDQQNDTRLGDPTKAPVSVEMERPDAADSDAPASRRGVSVPPPIKRTPRPLDSVRSERRLPQAVSFSRRREPEERLTIIGPERPRQIAVENVSPIR